MRRTQLRWFLAAARAAVAVALLSVGIGATSPQIRGEPQPPARPLDQQNVTLEFGDNPHPTALTLCQTTQPRVLFEERLEEQIYRVFNAYPTSMNETMRRLTARSIVRESRKHNLDPWLLVGLIRVESAFYNYAVSHKDAMGLTQFLPWVGKAVARDIGMEWHGAETLFHPIKNVQLATVFLARLRDRFEGNIERALQAYNLGPTRLSQWLARGRSVPTGYSAAVMSFWRRYAALENMPEDDLSLAIQTAERRYARERAARLTASVGPTSVPEAPEDQEVAAALEANVDAVEAGAPPRDDTEHEAPAIPSAPDDMAPRF